MGYAALALAAGLLDVGSGLFSSAVAVSPLTVQPSAAPVLGQLAQVGAPANPVLLQPGAEGNESTTSQATPPSPAEPEASGEASAEENAPENDIPQNNIPENSSAAPDNALPPNGERRLGWWLLGILSLASLGSGLFLGRGKQRPRASGIAPAPAADAPPSPSQTEGTTAAAALAETNALATTELSLETTTRLSSMDIVDSLINQLASTDSAQRRHAIWELGQRGHSAAIQPLVNGLLEADSQEKSLIFAALAEISSRNLKPIHRALALGLQDPSPEVRKNAIRDLAQVYDPVVQLSQMLAHAAQDPDLEVQKTAQWALGQLGRIAAAPYPSEPATLESAYDGEGHRLPPS